MWWIAFKTLVADRGKFITALVGVAFSVILVNVQGGLFIGLINKTSILVDNCDAEIWIGHHGMHNVDFPKLIPVRWIDRVRSVPGVERAEPYLVTWCNTTLPSGGFEEILLLGVDHSSLLGNAWEISQGSADAIRQTDGIIVDEADDERLEHPKIGEIREVGGQRTRIVAKSRGIVGFLVAPYAFTTFERAAALSGTSVDECSYYLVQVTDEHDSKLVAREIRQRVPEVDVLTREQYSAISKKFWLTRTGIGLSFGAATVLGLAVGTVIVGQTLYGLVVDRLSEYGALKAIGAQEGQLRMILIIQALIMAFVGSAVGLASVFFIQRLASTPRTTIDIPLWVLACSCVIVFAICIVSSLLPYLRIVRLDPALVMQQ